jgi:hypothetical protein
LNRQWRAHEVLAEGNIDGDGIDAGMRMSDPRRSAARS